MRVSVRAEGRCPNDKTLKTFEHEAWMAPTPLAKSKIVDPGLVLTYRGRGVLDEDRVTGSWAGAQVVLVSEPEGRSIGQNIDRSRSRMVEEIFIVRAIAGVAAWVWLDYPSGAIVEFEANGFWLRKGQARGVGLKVVSDSTDGKWKEGVTVQSLWNDTLSR